jgi:tetratricopeptide (TPR) repeat protein
VSAADSKYKEFFICYSALLADAFRLLGAQAIFREFHVTNPGGSPSDQTRDPRFEEILASGQGLLARDAAGALALAQELLRTDLHPRALQLAAAALRKLDRPQEAEQAELTGIKASFAIQELDDAAVAGHDGRNEESRVMVERFIAREPDNLLALTMAAEADIHAWDLECAEQRLRIVLGRAPSFLRAIMLLAKCLTLQARLKEAVALVEEVVQRKPNNLTALQYLGELHGEANEHERAADVYGRVVNVEPGMTEMWIVLAQELRMLGRRDASKAAFRSALNLDPNNGAAWWGLANYFMSDISEGDVAAMEYALANRHGTSADGGPLHIALGLVAEKKGDFANAFRQISEGKQLRASAHPYDPILASANVDALIDALGPTRFTDAASAGSSDNSPIFIIGMPRSGTTLLERILSQHSQIDAGGELPILPRLHARLRRDGDAGYANRVATMPNEELTRLGEWYVERSSDYRTDGKPRFIDKNNSNWFHAGLIRLILPQARIIDLRRNALDCCWSNFKMLFAEGAVASNDQRDIARFYGDYVRMVEAVDAVSPGGILKVKYEDLVDDVEGQTRRILEFLALDYEPACIDFHKSTAAVATPSSEQVRRPINRDGIGSAEPYREWLDPMIEELASLSL